MNRIPAILLLFVFLFGMFGTGIFFHFEQHHIHKAREAAFKKQNSIKLVVTKEDIRSGKYKRLERKEFLYDGHMFDVVSETTDASGNIVFSAYNDKRETRALAIARRENQKTPFQSIDWLKLFSQHYVPSEAVNFHSGFALPVTHPAPEYSLLLRSDSPPVPPPPERF